MEQLTKLINDYNEQLSQVVTRWDMELNRATEQSDFTPQYYDKQKFNEVNPILSSYKSRAEKISSLATRKINDTRKNIDSVLYPKSNSLDQMIKAEGMSEVQQAMILTSNPSKASKITNMILDSYEGNKIDLANSIVKFTLMGYDESELMKSDFALKIKSIQDKFSEQNGLNVLEFTLNNQKNLESESDRFSKAIDEKVYPYYSREIIDSLPNSEVSKNLDSINKSLAI